MPLNEALRRHGAARADIAAAVIGGDVISYGALARMAGRLDTLVAGLPRVTRSQPALRDVPVFAILMGNHPTIPTFLAAALAGRCCVMLLDPLMPTDRVCTILDRLPPDILFTAGAAEDYAGRGFPVQRIADVGDLDVLLADTPDAALVAGADDDPFLIAFTSGTTSQPKAFLRNRQTWRRSLEVGRTHFETGPQLHTYSPGPLAHGLALYAFAETLEAGATFHAPVKFSAVEAWSAIADRQLARLVCVPSVLEALYRHGAALDSLRQITTAGAKLADDLLVRTAEIAPHARVTEYYGASELGFVSTVTHPSSDSAGVGRAFPGVEIGLRGADAAGAGTVWVRSGLTIDGYLWQDDASGFQRDGDWTTVGDIGRIDDAGCLHLLARGGGMVISGGNNIYPDEINACLRQHPAISEACVLGIPDDYLGRALVAVIAWENDSPGLTAEELIGHCRQHLQKYKIPRRFLIVRDWPVTTSGKIATGQLAEWIIAKDDRLVPL